MPPLGNDTSAMLASVAYLLVVLGVAEASRRRLRVPADVTRKAFLAATGTWGLAAVHLFENLSSLVGLFVGIAVLAYFSFRFELFASVEDDGPGLGSVLLPLAAAGLIALFWGGELYIGLAGVIAAAWGDAAAALVGRRLGTRKLRISGHARTMEGTLALFLASSATMTVVLALSGGLDWHRAVAFSLITGTVAASVELVSVYGSDNLTVPVAASGTLWLLVKASA